MEIFFLLQRRQRINGQFLKGQNGQSLRQFSDRNGTKTIPFGTAHTYWALYKGVPIPLPRGCVPPRNILHISLALTSKCCLFTYNISLNWWYSYRLNSFPQRWIKDRSAFVAALFNSHYLHVIKLQILRNTGRTCGLFPSEIEIMLI